MAIQKQRFFYHEDGSHAETWYYLAKDNTTDRVFVVHEWANKASVGERELDVEEFLKQVGQSSARNKFLDLIGRAVFNVYRPQT